MMDKPIDHNTALETLKALNIEAAANAISGDLRVASDGRRDYLFSAVLIGVLSAVGEDKFDSAEYPDLPTPEQLAAQQTETPTAPPPTPTPTSASPPPPPAQPNNADELTRQEISGADIGATVNPAPVPDAAPAPAPDATPAPAPDATPAPAPAPVPDAAPAPSQDSPPSPTVDLGTNG